mmetsp:Transcript_24686/g.56133  ORF Transcript_24686/g.56133 Transcript_24686/m.56133 type:complete len:179 (-) Transcript_24686:71-607(-)
MAMSVGGRPLHPSGSLAPLGSSVWGSSGSGMDLGSSPNLMRKRTLDTVPEEDPAFFPDEDTSRDGFGGRQRRRLSVAQPSSSVGFGSMRSDLQGDDVASRGAVLPPDAVRSLLEQAVGAEARIDAGAARLVARMAERMLDEVVGAAARVARHRGSRTLETSDLRFVLEQDWGVPPPRS